MKKKLYLIVATLVALVALLSATGAVFAEDAKSLDQQDSYDDIQAWHFVITGIDVIDNAPDTIHVIWDNGFEDDIDRSDFTGGTAHYWAYANLDTGLKVTSATAVLYDGWNGQFNLSHIVRERPPVPELSAGILFGLGLLGLGGFVLFKRRNQALTAK